ncbi:hypothetical protein MRS76_14755 [Rhizobiaceae bacterium n13]|uniref:PEP-CTERM sorting domain-containing protein n=1 Tax=Ferirhizobium litorale TaxID=2927786 RepID=A0AAE3QDA6_9HYPH|nr:hypothetical protein [Fererhizobium litorale]MDI7863215.1 hypothetical protein [Fererhizobium litorale]MDI7923050.1 hypothetical protein [Fererhizobium litorale]
MRRRFCILVALLSPALVSAGPADDGRWYAGAYSFSDERGGFHILSVSGIGTKTDPIEITEEFYSASPVTLVIRAAGPARQGAPAEGTIHLRIVAHNESGAAWIEFEFELQEIRGKPSDFYDGLSFDQTNPNPDFIRSSRFARFETQFESFDRLRFTDGYVDPRTSASFGFFVTDVTPVGEFYLVQDPRIPST